MKWTSGWLCFSALIAFAGAVSISSPASAKGTTLNIQVTDVSGTVTSATVVEALDTTGKVTTCDLLKLVPGSDSGSFKCDTTGYVAPLLLMEQPPISSPPLYGISETGIGTANINALTSIGTEQTFLALGTSAALQWSSMSPIPITAPMLGSSLGLLDRTFAQPMVAYKFTPQVALTYNYYENKPTSGLINLLKQSTLIGIGGTGTETAQIALPGSIDFSASITPLPSASGSSSRWTVQASTGISYFSAFGKYPIASNAPAVYTAVGEYYTNFLGLLKHEKSKLDAGNLDIYSPAYFSDGNDALIQSYLDATRLRQLKVSQFSVGTIASLQNGVPDSSSSLIRVNVLRFSTDHGVPCTDECCVSLACNTEGCLDYGNQQIARLGLRYISESDSSGGSPTILQYLNADGSAPTGTLSGLTIGDLSGIYPSPTTIPFTHTRDIMVKPFHNGSGFTLPYDDYSLKTDLIPPIPSTDRFTFTPFPTIGIAPSTTLFPPPSTSEAFNLIKGPQALGDIVGKKVKLEWKLPLTTLVTGQSVSGDECTGSQTQRVMSKPLVVSPYATSATLKFDKALGGTPITGVDYRITERSFGGPTLEYRLALGISCSF